MCCLSWFNGLRAAVWSSFSYHFKIPDQSPGRDRTAKADSKSLKPDDLAKSPVLTSLFKSLCQNRLGQCNNPPHPPCFVFPSYKTVVQSLSGEVVQILNWLPFLCTQKITLLFFSFRIWTEFSQLLPWTQHSQEEESRHKNMRKCTIVPQKDTP